MALVKIGSNNYVLRETKDGKPPIRQGYIPKQSNPLRLTGVTLRENDPSMGHFIWPQFADGIGFTRMNRQNGRGVYGLRDATCDTRFRPVTLGRLHESQTHNVPSDHVRAYANFNGDFWGLFEQDYSATALECVNVAKWGATSDTWDAVDCPLYNDSSAGFETAANVTVSHTVQSTFGNRIVIAFVGAADAGGAPAAPSSVTYAGAAMTKLTDQTGGNANISLWYKVAPTTGANDCVATGAASTDFIIMNVLDYYFVNQSSPFGTQQAAGQAGVNTTGVSAVTTSSGDLVVGSVFIVDSQSITVGAGQVEREDTAGASSALETSEERATGTSVTWSASWSGAAADYAAIAAPLLSDGFVCAPETTVAEGVRGFDMVVHKSTLCVLASRGGSTEQHFQVFSSSDGDTFTPYANLPAGANNLLDTTIIRRNNFDDCEGKLLDFNTLLIAAVYDGVTDTRIEVYSTNDVGGSAWTAQGNVTDRHVHRLLKWKDPTNLANLIPILVTERNVYKVNTTTNSLDALLPEGILTGSADDGRGAVVGLDGALYLPLATGRIRKVEIAAENSFVFSFVGPVGDGLVTARQGHVNDLLVVPEPWLVCAYGGHAANKTASIFCIDYAVRKDPETGLEYQPWHSAYSETDANIDLYLLGYSQEDDATARLFFALESATSAEMYHIEEAFTHPLGSTTIKYQTSSILRLPTDDMGDPNTSGGIFSANVDADDLTAGTAGVGGATDEFIQLEYGLDGNGDTTTELGDFLSGAKTLNFGSSGVGVSGSKIAVRLTLDRGSTNTSTPKLYEFEMEARKKLLGPRFWEFTIDIAETARGMAQAPTSSKTSEEVIISAIETLAETGTLSTFESGQSGSVLVQVPDDAPPVFELQTAGSAGLNTGYRTGFITLRVSEVR